MTEPTFEISRHSVHQNGRLATGNYGDVYKGTYQGEKAAIKVFMLPGISEDFARVFHEEVREIAELQSKRITQVFGAYINSDQYVTVMERMQISLKDFLQDEEREFLWFSRWRVAIQIGKGLLYLHEHNMCHGNLASSNVLLTQGLHAKLGGIGLSATKAKVIELGSRFIRNRDRWKAPELYRSESTPTQKSDIFSFGMVLYEVAARTPPFSDASDEELTHKRLTGCFQEQIPDDAPAEYAALTQRCWSVDPNKRPSSQEIVSNLRSNKAISEGKQNAKREELTNLVFDKLDAIFGTFPRKQDLIDIDVDSQNVPGGGIRILNCHLKKLITEKEIDAPCIEHLWKTFPEITDLSFYSKSTKYDRNLTPIAKFTNLVRLEIANAQSEQDSVFSLSSLRELHLTSNQISVIPDRISSLSLLQVLMLGCRQLSVIPDGISSLSSLQVLALVHGQLSVIPDTLFSLSSLTILHLSSNQISLMPDGISSLTSLRELNLSSNQISLMPDGISSFRWLRELNLCYNKITAIPDALFSLSFLTALHLRSNQIPVMPDALFSLSYLKELCLSSNQISFIPNRVSSLTSLQKLNFGHNKISVIPDGVSSLILLQKLDLRYNKIAAIPDGISSLILLQKLDFRFNNISAISDRISSLTLLQKLDLRFNNISAIPNEISSLASLQKLNLRSNKISAIPDKISSLTSLQEVDLRNNQNLTTPNSLQNLTSLRILI